VAAGDLDREGGVSLRWTVIYVSLHCALACFFYTYILGTYLLCFFTMALSNFEEASIESFGFTLRLLLWCTISGWRGGGGGEVFPLDCEPIVRPEARVATIEILYFRSKLGYRVLLRARLCCETSLNPSHLQHCLTHHNIEILVPGRFCSLSIRCVSDMLTTGILVRRELWAPRAPSARLGLRARSHTTLPASSKLLVSRWPSNFPLG
jgi:hypothetical protein